MNMSKLSILNLINQNGYLIDVFLYNLSENAFYLSEHNMKTKLSTFKSWSIFRSTMS